MSSVEYEINLKEINTSILYTRALNYESITSNHALHHDSKLVVTGNNTKIMDSGVQEIVPTVKLLSNVINSV